ncbi:histidine phosphatase family protein [Tuberibacillus sp. Marseille-P3662]|uniref:histidine phosphatase family protein n=1 Tax=Tuberibacillus sp. Marseille-P3662 TaxID=1965358 RepID=UPI000A1CEB75|nr:histidine phosphatase family protein [Tuberibacillus sp. Marseille-P3662]
MIRLLLTRHGETEWNANGRMQGRADSPLTDLGYKQAQELARKLNDESIDVIISSPSKRAIQTAELIKGQRDAVIHRDEHFLEMDVGEWEGQTKDEIEALDLERHQLFWEQPHLFKTDQGEDFYHVRERVLPRLKHLIRDFTDQNILIVTHSVVLKILLSYFEQRPLEKLWEGPYIHGTSLSVVDIDEEETNIALYADTSHFSDPISAKD